IARNMVTKWGLSDNLGPLMYEEEDKGGFMGTSRNANVSGEISKEIDHEIRALIDRNYKRATDILTEHSKELEAMTEALMQYETIDAEQIKNIMEGRPAGAPKDWADSDDKDKGSSAGAADETPVDAGNPDDMVKDDLSGDDSAKGSDSGEPKLH
ncbi:MAG: ATP-dependent metalloprotease, partial [Thiomicrorhabdus sp.]|nr:ATP-dependent metalloprotease [Thiomicrorhabdus sp.]